MPKRNKKLRASTLPKSPLERRCNRMVLGALHTRIHLHTFANTHMQQQKKDTIHS